LQSIEERLVDYKKNEAVLTDKINALNLEVRLRDKVLAEYTKNLETAEKERDKLKLTLEKLQNSFKALNSLLDSQVSDKSKAGIGYKEITFDSFVNSSGILDKQENRSDKEYHVVPPPLTGNYIPSKRDLRLIDEHFESVSVDVISNIAPSDVKTIDVNHKGMFSIEEPKPVMKNNSKPPIIEDWHSDDERNKCYLTDLKAYDGGFVSFRDRKGSKENLVAGQDDIKKTLEQEYILIPICTTDPLISQGSKDSTVDVGKKAPEVDESEASDNGRKNDQVSRSEVEGLPQQTRQTKKINSPNSFNTVSSPVNIVGSSFVNAASQTPLNAAGPSASTNAFEEHSFERFSPFKNAFSLPHVPIVTPIDDTGIFGNAYDDEVLEEEVDMNNVDLSYVISEATKNKKDEKGIVIKNKARLVAQGHTQEEVYQMDVKSAFLYGRIKEEVGQIDKTLFIKRHKDDILLVQVYVDDIIFGPTKEELSTEFEKLMHDKFQMSSMEELSFFLGLQVKQKSDGIFISQDKYVAKVLKKFNFVNMKTTSTPMESNKPLIKDEEAEDVDVHLYRLMIGSLMYLTSSRPDITFAVCACARFQVNPKTSHLQAVKRIFRYLKGQPKLGLCYPNDSPFDLEAYFDSDYARSRLDKKSTIEGCQFLGKTLISWQCKKQTIVANYTTEAEYVAAANCYG
nr:hypothetical protein [Tanacetum cinerariifolium]